MKIIRFRTKKEVKLSFLLLRIAYYIVIKIKYQYISFKQFSH